MSVDIIPLRSRKIEGVCRLAFTGRSRSMKKIIAIIGVSRRFSRSADVCHHSPAEEEIFPPRRMNVRRIKQRKCERTMKHCPIQEVDLGGSGRSILIAVVMLSHILFANLHLGGAWIAAGTESVFLRNKKERFKRLARSLALFNVILFSAGATLAMAGILFFIALFPGFLL